MKKDALIVNTSRGPIIRETDLIEALKKQDIGGAALDVFDIEPLPQMHPLREIKNVILTPYIGSISSEAYQLFFNGYIIAIKVFLDGNSINQIN